MDGTDSATRTTDLNTQMKDEARKSCLLTGSADLYNCMSTHREIHIDTIAVTGLLRQIF